MGPVMQIQTGAAHQLPSDVIQKPNRPLIFGYVAMAITVLVWAGFALTARSGGQSALSFGDIAFIRAVVPTLIFLPFIPSRMPAIRRAGLWNCGLIAVGAGLPFFWLAVAGGAVTSAMHVGTVISGTVPVFVTALMWALSGIRPSKRGVMALVLIVSGVVLLASAKGGDVALSGILTLLCASMCWAVYTISMKRSGLDPVSCAIVIAVPSSIVICAMMLTGLLVTNWGSYPISQTVPYVLVQGFGVGVIASLTYAFANSRLGAKKSATLGSMTPVLTAILAVPILGEALGLSSIISIAAICSGVLLFNRT